MWFDHVAAVEIVAVARLSVSVCVMIEVAKKYNINETVVFFNERRREGIGCVRVQV